MDARKWSGKSRGGTLGTWFFMITIRHLGVGAAYALLLVVAPYFVLFAPSASRAIWRYNRQIHGMSRLRAAAMIPVHYYRFGQTLIDRVAIKHNLLKGYTFDYENFNEFLQLLDSGNGAIIVSAHVGAWEAGIPFFMHYGRHMNIVMLDAEYQTIKRVKEREELERDFKIIPLGADGLESLLRIKAALDKKEFVCFQGDRFMDANNSVKVSFMGRPARFPKSIFHMASKLRVPVVFYFATRSSGRKYTFHFDVVDGRECSEAELRHIYISSLEKIVRRNPQQWFNFYDFWDPIEP